MKQEGDHEDEPVVYHLLDLCKVIMTNIIRNSWYVVAV